MFELVQMETGLEGNFLLCDCSVNGILCQWHSFHTHTRYKVLWNYLHECRLKLFHVDDIIVPHVHEQDQVFMEVAIQVFPWPQWVVN
jgi:hypothetical protein